MSKIVEREVALRGSCLKAYNQSRYFREQAQAFTKSGVIIETISEQITSAREKALLHLYKGADDNNLDILRYRMFCQKWPIPYQARNSTANICSCKISLVSSISLSYALDG